MRHRTTEHPLVIRAAALGVAATCASLILGPARATAQEPAAPPAARTCAAPEARQFDFWLGDWAITQHILRADGSYLQLPASTSVSRALDGCALVEQWVGPVEFFWEGMRSPEVMQGLSVRAFDPAARVWRIHWMDTRSPAFGEPYVGTFDGGRGEFHRVWTTAQGRRQGRITFVVDSDSTVNWMLAVSTDGGTTEQVIWRMTMRRARRTGCALPPGESPDELERLHERWSQAIRREDVDTILALLADDYTLLAPSTPPVHKGAVRALMTAAFARGDLEAGFECVSRVVEGSLAVEHGWDVSTVRLASGEERVSRQRVTLVLRRTPGVGWQFLWGMSQPGPTAP